MTVTSLPPTNLPTQLAVAFLTPMLLAAAAGDRAQAEAMAMEAISIYAARNPVELLVGAEAFALGLGVLSSISLSMAENIPISLILRLRTNAASLHRAADQCRRALARPDHDAAAEYEAPLSHADLQEAAIIAEVSRTQRQVADPETSCAQPPSPTANPATAPSPQAATHPSPMTEDEYFRAAWSAAMTDVAREVAAEIPMLAPTERRAARIRANALNTTASHLLGNPLPPTS